MNHKLRLLEQEILQDNKDKSIFKARLNFEVGNTVKVNYRIVEGEKERVQPFEGIVISIKKSSDNYNCTFTVRRVNQGYGVERVFHLYSPRIESINVLKDTFVRRSKLYYLRQLSGKAARLKDKSRKVQRRKRSVDVSS